MQGYIIFILYLINISLFSLLSISMKKLSHITILDQYAVDMGIVLGQGSTGCVYQGLDMKTCNKVAIKIVDLRTIDNEVAQYLLNMQKIAIMKTSSPYVLQGLKVAEDYRYCFMITEYCNGGTLKKYIRNSPNGYLCEQKALKIINQILIGYKSLVYKNITHRDLKPANIMLHNETPKIIDFGYCQIKGYPKPSLEYNVGSPSYMAPESFQSNIYNQKTQIWAIGVILFQCLTGRTIDEGRHMSEVYHQLQISGVPYPPHVSYFAKNIINWCLSKNPKNRPTCSQLLETCFSNKTRSKSKLSPYKSQVQKFSVFKKICGQKIPSNFNTGKAFKQISKNRSTSGVDDILIKSTKIDNRKHYKVPEFLQASQKGKAQKVPFENRLNVCYSSRGQLVQPKLQRKAYNNNKQNNKYLSTHCQYGQYNGLKNSYKASQAKHKINLQQIYQKIYRNDNIQKNRVVSTHISTSPSHKLLRKTPSKNMNYGSKQFLSRNKRTFTERGNPIRA